MLDGDFSMSRFVNPVDPPDLGTLPTKPDLTKVITEKYLPGAPH